MRTVLLIEDNQDIRETLADILAYDGYTVIEATDGKDALLRLQGEQQGPDVIILDLQMPVMSGGEFLATLRQSHRWQHLPVIVCSGTVDPGLAEALAPLAGCLRKPVDVPQLLALVAACHPRDSGETAPQNPSTPIVAATIE